MVVSQGQMPSDFLLTCPYVMVLVSPYGKWLFSDFHNTMALQRSNWRRQDNDIHGIKKRG